MRRLILTCSLLVLVACSGNPPAPIEDRRVRYSGPTPGTYTVKGGDTLYGIAFVYGLDYRRVAALNGIPAPYTIYPGQRLKLKGSPPSTSSRSTPASAPKTAPKTAATPVPKPVPTAPVATPKPAAPSTKSTTVTQPSSAPTKTVGPEYTGAPVKQWRWPAQGRVTRRFSSSLHKGIDIAGERGDAVVATAAGKVVYSGTGIVGFGELLIIKHNEQYLSAYGHNDRLLVGEGDTVRAGEKIAEKGSTGTETVNLHFEIRRDGKPIDPIRLLPRR
ncbi:MAG: peptidoglycan DD-metalloendopeptidase family protein [Halieaceae bacterium]|nr:peptidoglycan DD-metalloendopeptidase family protein [Halieaceae bacterium]